MQNQIPITNLFPVVAFKIFCYFTAAYALSELSEVIVIAVCKVRLFTDLSLCKIFGFIVPGQTNKIVSPH